jgi:ribulose 1,5-bisphosphate carboxylase large subunit-like protein
MDLEDAIVCTYELAGAFPIQDAARIVAAEQTTGTWTDVKTAPKSVEERLAGHVVSTDPRTNLARIRSSPGTSSAWAASPAPAGWTSNSPARS